MDPALSIRGLTKRYDDGTLALEDFDLEIPAGAFFGLLGPNGAGKTTLISAVCNLIRVSEGEVLVFGEPAKSLLARSWIGLAEQDINLDRFLSVRPQRVRAGRRVRLRLQARPLGAPCAQRATIRLAGRRVRTNLRGRASLRVRPRRLGRRRVTLTKPGCAPARAWLRVVR